MHSSVWTFRGDPEQLLQAYDRVASEILPALKLHLCLRTRDGILLVDTCPDREAFNRFARERGIPRPPRAPRTARARAHR